MSYLFAEGMVSCPTCLPTYLPILLFFSLEEFLKNRDFETQKSFFVIQTALQYNPLLNINRSEKWGKINTNRGL